ncbi:hypothetical protein [Acinetobacter vivianii]|uniref:hypothetical protein n=1 Tax=Acinetobacter vivianii TaxID=1776742 RepID=UPI002DBADA86|nr:hypothetical protein [Acinetobacter vivianii]MEB6478631.1 hypothetical protein [Acinetobacter vivianii]MEB6657538.1 hypothetical protein [Acinetobacter vivianii]
MFKPMNLKKSLAISISVYLSLMTGCANTPDAGETLKNGGDGAAGMLLIDSEVYRKAANRQLDAVTVELLFSTIAKMSVLERYEKDSKGAYLLEDTFNVGNANQFCWVNKFLLEHRKEIPANLDYSDTYKWVDAKQLVLVNMLNETLGDKRMKNDCRS